MAQVQPSHHQFSGGQRFHARQESASSILAATTFGANYNPLATPSNTTPYDGMVWGGTLSVSPSIWSPNHVGNCQWPAMRQPRAPVMGYYGQNGYTYAPRQQALPLGMLNVPHNSQIPQSAVAQQTQAQQTQQVRAQTTHAQAPAGMGPQMLVPQAPAGSSMQQMSMPVSGAYPPLSQMMPQVAQFPVYHLRAPVQSYQTIAAPDASAASALEYNVTNMSRFVATVGSGFLLGKPASFHEFASLEQFIQTLLCSTRLPRSTVITSIVLLKQFVSIRKTDPKLQRLSLKNCFLVSFVLANKINDDNTFTNASWGLVSGISAKQLTSIELSWLDAAKWNISLDDQGENEWAYWQNYWLQAEHHAVQQCTSPVTPTSLWPNQGYFFEPFSVAAC